MLLKIINKDLFFVVEGCWAELDYRFKYQLNQLVADNPGDYFLQAVDVDVKTLMQCYKALQQKEYGCAVNAADPLLEDIRRQLLASQEDPEYSEALALFEAERLADQDLYEKKCASGKEQILS